MGSGPLLTFRSGGIEFGKKFIRRKNGQFAGGVIGLVAGDNRADAAFRLRGEMLNRILKILEAG